MASSRTSSKPLDLDVTVVSAKHLKNVNWRTGDLKPYAVFWLDPHRYGRLATKPDDAGSTRPVWNERFTLPITAPLSDSFLTLEIFHSKPSDTPNPLVGTLTFPLKDLISSDHDYVDAIEKPIRTLELRRPSGRPQGKIRLKLSLRERPMPPPPMNLPQTGYYTSAVPPPNPTPPPPPPREYGEYSHPPYTAHPPPSTAMASPYPYGNYSDPYSYAGCYPGQPLLPPPPQPFYDRPVAPSYGLPSGPSAPVDYSSYDQKKKGGSSSKVGLGTGLAVGAVAGALGGLALEEGIKYEEEKVTERVEGDIAARDGFDNYRSRDY